MAINRKKMKYVAPFLRTISAGANHAKCQNGSLAEWDGDSHATDCEVGPSADASYVCSDGAANTDARGLCLNGVDIVTTFIYWPNWCQNGAIVTAATDNCGTGTSPTIKVYCDSGGSRD